MSERDALLVLNAVPNLGARVVRKLKAHFGSARQVLESSLERLSSSCLLTSETAQNIIDFSKDKFLQDEYNLMQRCGVEVVTAVDCTFPCSLNDFDDSPVVLYVKGEIDVLNQASVGVVGSRATSYYGLKIAKVFAREFVEAGFIVTSGMARGIDTAAHQGALSAGGKTIAVLGCGFNYVYPKENHSLMQAIASQGAVVSEFAFSMPPLKHNFPWRNRIISGLSKATVVIEAGLKSGALITANFAVAQNKDVFVVPANIDMDTARGSNRLIQEGAMLALNPDDVLLKIKVAHRLSATDDEKPLFLLSEEQETVYTYITNQPIHLDELLRQSGLNISSLMNVTLSLELKRAIRQLPGQYYVRNEHV